MPIIDLTQSARDIIFISSAYIDSIPNYYPTAEGLAQYVNGAMPDETVTLQDIKIASAVIGKKYPDIFGVDKDALEIENTLVNAFSTAMSLRITEQSSFIKDFAIIFTIVLGGYLIFRRGKQNA
jgi:hypothetical protein